jgi:hypothetical protein
LAKLIAPHQVAQQTFITNITTQVIERHIVRRIERIFSLVVVNGLTNSEAGAIAMEPAAARRQRHCKVGRWACDLKRGYEKYLDRIYNNLDK